ncbi:MAG: cell wall-binding repeat-containing protein [bacterium]|nr:cell wall-binding repeat-containing protein [bacterium]
MRRTAVLVIFGLAISVFGLPISTLAATAGVWQTPLTYWLVDGYQFGEMVTWNQSRPYHLGEDAHGEAGTPVFAPANGTVELAMDMNGGGWGGIVLIENTNQAGDTVVSLHGHLDFATVQVSEGQAVERGQLIGYLGDTSTNGGWISHLHFGIRNGPFVPLSDDWVYYGYGDETELQDWLNPSDYIDARLSVIEVERVPEDSPNRYSTAVGVSERRFPEESSANKAYLASGESFADALAAAPLTNSGAAPLLLTTKNKLPQETADELARVVQKNGEVHILGGVNTISADVEKSVTDLGFSGHRIAGENRESTAALVADQFKNAKSAFIVNRDAFPDAVSAGGPSNMFNLPLLFTDDDSLNSISAAFLENHTDIATVYIIGGSSVVSLAVEEQLSAIASVNKVERVAGQDRYQTNLKVIERFTPKPETLLFATGSNYPDALTGSALVSAEKGSLLLMPPTNYSEATQSFIDSTRPALDAALILGGTAAISADLDASLAASLNTPLTLASASAIPDQNSAQTRSTQTLTVRADQPTTLAGVLVPSIAGLTVHERLFNGAVVAEQSTQALSAELAAPLSVTRVMLEGRSSVEALADWFGIDQNYVSAHIIGSETLPELTEMPRVVPARSFYVTQNDAVVLIDIRLNPEQTQTVLEQIQSSLPQ